LQVFFDLFDVGNRAGSGKLFGL